MEANADETHIDGQYKQTRVSGLCCGCCLNDKKKKKNTIKRNKL